MAPRPNSKIQPRGQNQINSSASNANIIQQEVIDDSMGKEAMLQMMKALNEKVEIMAKVSFKPLILRN